MNYSRGFNNSNMYPHMRYNNVQMPLIGVTCMNGMPNMTPSMPGMPGTTPGMPGTMPGMPPGMMPDMEMPEMPFIPDSQMPELPGMPEGFMPDGDMPALPSFPQDMQIDCQQLLELARAMGCLDETNSTEAVVEEEPEE